MAVTGTYTNSELITDALRKIGVVSDDEAASADQISSGLRALNRMLKAWQNYGYNLWTVAEQTLTLTTAASYTLSPERPIRILGARYIASASSSELPMCEMTRQEYDDLPVKTNTGTPTQFYYDRQREDALFYVWPVLASASGQTIKITYEREIEDQTDTSSVTDVPGEWWEAVVYNLADRLSDDYMIEAPKVTARAERELSMALGADREGSVYFCGPYAD